MGTYILKNNVTTGPHGDVEILNGLASGAFSCNDLAQREGMADWQPLVSVLAVQPPSPPVLREAPTSPHNGSKRTHNWAAVKSLLPVALGVCLLVFVALRSAFPNKRVISPPSPISQHPPIPNAVAQARVETEAKTTDKSTVESKGDEKTAVRIPAPPVAPASLPPIVEDTIVPATNAGEQEKEGPEESGIFTADYVLEKGSVGPIMGRGRIFLEGAGYDFGMVDNAQIKIVAVRVGIWRGGIETLPAYRLKAFTKMGKDEWQPISQHPPVPDTVAQPPAPSTVVESTPPPPKRLAPAGVYYLLERVSITTDGGIAGLPPGTGVKLLSQNGTELKVTDGSHEFTVNQPQVTNDLDVALAAVHQDQQNQNSLAAWQETQAQAGLQLQRQTDKEIALNMTTAGKSMLIEKLQAQYTDLSNEEQRLYAQIKDASPAAGRATSDKAVRHSYSLPPSTSGVYDRIREIKKLESDIKRQIKVLASSMKSPN
jgi:hypothetical protein